CPFQILFSYAPSLAVKLAQRLRAALPTSTCMIRPVFRVFVKHAPEQPIGAPTCRPHQERSLPWEIVDFFLAGDGPCDFSGRLLCAHQPGHGKIVDRGHRRLNETRTNGRDRNSARLKLYAKTFHEHIYSRLAGTIARFAR